MKKIVFNKVIDIAGKMISEDCPVFIIAEAGVNHGGDINIAKKLIDIAAEAGADAVKFQTFKAENLILPDVDKAPYQQKTTDLGQSQFEMLKSLEVTREQNIELKRYCDEQGIIFLTTPFDEESLDELDTLDLPAYKVASTDTTNLSFLRKIASKGKPIILSTGMSYLSEIELALQEMKKFNKDIILLQCTANYPIQDNEVNLAVINTYKSKFDIIIGYSDHTVGVGAAPYAIPMGAKVLEKHFTMSKELEGPDHRASLSPDELSQFIKTVRLVEEFMGQQQKIPSFSEILTRKSLQKCVVAKKKIECNEQFSEENITAKRTGGLGISALYYDTLIGKRANKSYKPNDIIDK